MRYIIPLLLLSIGWAQEVRQRICLGLSVCDDEAVIEECLASVQEIVDYVVVYDRGSTDQTPQIIAHFLNERRIPGVILSERFSIPLLVKHVHSLGWDLSTTYLLLLRPDAICVIDEAFSKASLKRDGYLVLEPREEALTSAYQPNFLRASAPWATAQPYVSEKIETFRWRVNDNESYQASRDQRQIAELLQEPPTDPDLLLRLAGLYKKRGSYDEAIHYYRMCAMREGNSDQIWLARTLLAECLETQGDAKNALYWTLEAYRIQPDREELLPKIFLPHNM